MNSHIVEKTMHSIKNIDRLTDLAAIDVYNTTHDTINKYEIMKEHATEEYTNESFYQESVLAGVLIGAGVLGVAISAFFIIKKIIDSKDSADSSVKSADGKMVAAQVDLTDPKSTEKYLSDLSDRLKKLTETKSIKVAKSINKDEFEAAEKQIKDWSDKLQNIIDNKHEATAIENIIDEISISSVDASKIFVDKEMDADVATFAEALGLKSISSFAALLTSLKKQIDDVEKMVNNKKDKEAENAVEISQDHLTKLKNQNNAAAKLIATLKAKSKETLGETDKAVLGAINAETEAKKKTEETNPTGNPASAGATENKTEKATDENKTGDQSAADTESEAGGSDNTGKKSSTSENVMGPGGQTERMKQASEAKQAAEAEVQNKKDVLYLNPKGDSQKDETRTPIIPAAAEKKANEKTLEDVMNMLKSGKSEEDIRNALAKNNYKTEQIDAFLTEANNRIVNERKSELLNQTLGGTKPKVLDGEVLPPETEAKPFKFPKADESTFGNNRREQGIDKVVENIRRLVPADSEEGSWDKIVPTLKTYGFKDDEINDYAVKNNIIPTEPEKKPEDQVKTEPENPPTSTETEESKTENKNLEDDKINNLSNTIYGNQSPEKKAAITYMLTDLRNGEAETIKALDMFKEVLNDNIRNGKKDIKAAQDAMNDRVTSYELIADVFGINADYLKSYDATIPTEAKSENENKEKSKPTASDFENFKNPEANPESQQRFNSEINNADKSSTQSVQSDEAALRQAALNRQAEVSSEPEKVAIADEDVKNLITFSNIPENFANDISKTITDDINNNTPFNVQHIKDMATNLSKENGEDFAVNAKQIQKVFRDMAAACKPQTDAVKQYIDAIDKTDINSLKSQEASAPVDNKPQLSPEEMTDQIVNNINQIPTSAINNANTLVSSSYDDATKQQIAKEVISKLQSSGQTTAAGSFASSLKTSLGYTDADLNSSELPLYGSEKGTYEPLTGKNQAMNMISNNPVDNGMIETVARLRNEGLDNDQIRQKLLAANWNPELIEGMLQKVNNIEVQNNPKPTPIPNQTGVINVDAAAENATPQNAQNNESIQYNISKALNDYKSTPFAQRHVNGLSAYGLENEVNNIITRAQSLRNTGVDPAKSITMREAFNNLWKQTGGGFGVPSKDKKKALEAAKEYTKLRMTEAGVGDFFQEMFALDSEYRRLIQECDIAIIREEKLKMIQEQQG